MAKPLRDRRTATDWAASGQVVEFAEKISSLERLARIVEADLAALGAEEIPRGWRDSRVAGSLEFGFADARRRLPRARVRATANVAAVCQRCLEAFELELVAEADLLLLELDEMAEGFEDHEVWELDDGMLRPLDIVEELLIMALPYSAMHIDLASCQALTAEENDEQERTTPFAALRAQMKQN